MIVPVRKGYADEQASDAQQQRPGSTFRRQDVARNLERTSHVAGLSQAKANENVVSLNRQNNEMNVRR
ncbi:hypothetical protein TH59_19575 [Pantoea ananatis]|jgi:hypothetical protein|nr:hypothetical protein B7764_18415 [Pantoea ananatis]PKC28093.1 hypothetical protein V462_24860 [Pantoea ananatis 15320]MDC7867377.1 hypothetical protein [Pantoea ananatis]PQK70707.1 hypothetical protein CG427_19220 [Pantoea ananatis]PQK97202.1 hypothetical protein CG434_19415 [Pantoea ananatis]